jgi:hypothetical protein
MWADGGSERAIMPINGINSYRIKKEKVTENI